MQHLLPTAPTFSLARSIDFLDGFPPCQGELLLGTELIRGAFSIDRRAIPFTVTPAGRRAIAVETPDPRAVPMVAAFLGIDDQLARFYDRAAGDIAEYRLLVRALRGLHHVRFRTLAEVTVHAVLGQRTPIALASKQKRQVSAALGPRIELDGRTLIAFPELTRLAEVDTRGWHAIVGNVAKARRLPGVIHGVAALGEDWLRTAAYADAVAALLAIDGIGPFSAAMILLRGLGRMDDVPLEVPGIAQVAEAVYGDAWNPDRIRARYGADLGYWSFYLKAGAARLTRGRLAS